jgi:UDPglucose 6-dehydrogenase
MRITMVGSGYVGLVSGVCFAELGHEVTCVDRDPGKVAAIERGEPPIHERGLEPLLRRHLGTRFRASDDLASAVLASDLTMIAVGTPFGDGQIDLGQVREAAREIGSALRRASRYHVVVVKSTVVPGTTDSVVGPLLEEASGKRIGPELGLGMNPEFLTEGQAVEDFLHPDRLVLGAADAGSLEALEALYARWAEVPVIRTNCRTAEMIKYASNALLATSISFANEVANLCGALGGVDAIDVMAGVHASAYLTMRRGQERLRAPLASFLLPGCGFGGSCLPKDVHALAAQGRAAGVPMRLLESVLTINEEQPSQVIGLLERHLPTLAQARIGVLGLAFKPDTDDLRESPGLKVIRLLLERGARVIAHDPVAMPAARRQLGDLVAFAGTLESCLEAVDAVVLVTRWDEYERVPALLRALPVPPLLVDGRRQLDRATVPRYEGIGWSERPCT